MKKSLSIFVLIFAVCALFAMNKNDNLSEAQGCIEWFGNIPFEYSGFKTTDGKLYLLEVEENADFSEDIIKETCYYDRCSRYNRWSCSLLR